MSITLLTETQQRALGLISLLCMLAAAGVLWYERNRDGPMVEFDTAPTWQAHFQLDLNTANETELSQLPGIGPSIAGRILEARRKQPFRQRKDLLKIKGIGAKTLDKIMPYLLPLSAEAENEPAPTSGPAD